MAAPRSDTDDEMTVDGAVVEDSNFYSLTIMQLLPAGPCGLVLAALMSSVASVLNSIATLATYDLYRWFLPDCSERQLVAIGRISGVVALVLSIALVRLLDMYGCLFAGVNEIISDVAPPITTVFVFGVLWHDANAVSARWTVRLGSELGAGIFFLNKLVPTTQWRV